MAPNTKYFEQRGASVLNQIKEENLDQVLTKQLQNLKPEHKTNLTNARNPPLWELNPSIYKNPSTFSRPPKYAPKSPPRIFPIPILNDLVVRHYRATQRVPFGIRGRWQPLLYLLLATLIAPPHNKCVLVVDCEGDFSVSQILESTPISMLPLPPDRQPSTLSRDERIRVRPPYHRPVLPSDLAHIYVIRPSDTREGPLCRAILAAKRHMTYGSHRSREREFWGTVVIGADAPGEADVDVVCGTMKCWLKIEQQYVPGLGARGVRSYEAALQRRDEHEAERAFAPLVARCVWGRFKFDERGLVVPAKERRQSEEEKRRVGGSRMRAVHRTPLRLRPAPWVVTRAAYRAGSARTTRARARSQGPQGPRESDQGQPEKAGV